MELQISVLDVFCWNKTGGVLAGRPIVGTSTSYAVFDSFVELEVR